MRGVQARSGTEMNTALRPDSSRNWTVPTEGTAARRRSPTWTAITNLVYTLAKREGIPISQSPEAVFRRIAGIGGKRLIYMNADFLKRFGGTSDFLVPLMIRRSLRAFGLTGYSVRGPFPATARRVCTELDRGAIVYLEVHRHPVYGNHHMLCYGYTVRDGRLMLRMADGWVRRIHDLPAGEELFALCTVVNRKKG